MLQLTKIKYYSWQRIKYYSYQKIESYSWQNCQCRQNAVASKYFNTEAKLSMLIQDLMTKQMKIES